MTLPVDIAELEAQLDPAARVVIAYIRQSHENLEQKISQLMAENAELKRLLFGRKSEKMPSIRTEVRRTIEAEEFAASIAEQEARLAAQEEAAPLPPDEAELKKARQLRAREASKPKRAERRGLRQNLPVVTERILVKPEQIPAGYTAKDFSPLGEGDVIRRIDHVREHLVVVEYQLEKLASKDGAHVITAEAPVAVASGGHYGPGLYAHVVTAKCADTMPLYRIEKSLERSGMNIARSTLCDLFHRTAELLQPIYQHLIRMAAADPYLNMDETPQPVLDKGKCRRGYVWTVLSPKVIGYVFSPTRAGDTATVLLNETCGWLQTDAFSGYNASTSPSTQRTSVGCWAHARRYYFKALETRGPQ